eukprot:7227530-Prymnesium_polylepis.1
MFLADGSVHDCGALICAQNGTVSKVKPIFPDWPQSPLSTPLSWTPFRCCPMVNELRRPRARCGDVDCCCTFPCAACVERPAKSEGWGGGFGAAAWCRWVRGQRRRPPPPRALPAFLLLET